MNELTLPSTKRNDSNGRHAGHSQQSDSTKKYDEKKHTNQNLLLRLTSCSGVCGGLWSTVTALRYTDSSLAHEQQSRSSSKVSTLLGYFVTVQSFAHFQFNSALGR